MYHIPAMHTLPSTQGVTFDPNYSIPGLELHIEHAKGYKPQRHVRVAACLQQGPEILRQADGTMCFYASRGLLSQNSLVTFDDKRRWVCDLYQQYWKTRTDIYLVLQYIERKETAALTTDKGLTRKLIEQEYDLIGYSTVKISNPDGTVRFGSYLVDLFSGPIYVEELREVYRREGMQVKFTLYNHLLI